jgi:hypothetical protein
MAINRNNGGITGTINKPSGGGNVVTNLIASQEFKLQDSTTEVDVLVIAGGGGGGAQGGGGGAGGFRDLKGEKVVAGTTIPVTVGAGGTGGYFGGPIPASDITPTSGADSVFGNPLNPITSTGGGRGGGRQTSGGHNAANGGSGGGGGSAGAAPGGTDAGTGTAGQGNNGGAGIGSDNVGGAGGGGAGAAGTAVPPGNGDGGGSTNQANFGRPGGVGAPSTIRNTARHFAGGGGGCGNTGNTTAFYSGGKGGFEGGGFGRNGGESPGIAPSGEINTGGGGGASTQPGSAAAPAAASGAGGSGIVIVKEKDKASGVFNMSAQYNSNKSGKWPSRQSFEVPNSIMFNTADSAYLNHQPSSGDGLTKYTISAWCKISQGFGSSSRWLFGAGSASGDNDYVLWTSGDVLKHSFDTEGSGNVIWAAKFRDPAAWQHIVVMVDTTDAVAENRVRAYANGIELNKSGESYPSQNYVTSFGKGSIDHRIGARAYSATGHYGGYICEFNFIAGQALKPGHFGEVDPDSPNIWRPKKYNGTYGDAGAYLEFKQSAVGSGSASTIGADTSGNGNHYTSTNVATTDQMTDTCTNNFANFNPLIAALEASGNATTPSFSEGNLRTVTANAGKAGGSSTIQMNTGKWYAEFEFDATNNSGSTITSLIGVTDSAQLNARSFGKVGERANDVAYAQTGNKVIGDSSSSFGNTYTTGDVIGVAVDLDNNAIYFSKNGTFQNSGDPTSGSSKTGAIALTDPASTVEGGYYFAVGEGTTETSTHIANFGSPVYSISTGNTDANGHGNFEYAVPSGYFALCTKNLAQYG